MIRSIATVLCRAVVRQLGIGGISIHAVVEATRISVIDLRLVEFGSPLEDEAAERPIDWGMGMALASKGAGK